MRERTGGKGLDERGFTLIEILVVVVILGILAAVVVFSVQDTSTRGDSTACQAEVSVINTATQAFYANSAAVPPQYPAGPQVSDLDAQLKNAHLLARGSVFPGATLHHNPQYDHTTGVFTADC